MDNGLIFPYQEVTVPDELVRLTTQTTVLAFGLVLVGRVGPDPVSQAH